MTYSGLVILWEGPGVTDFVFFLWQMGVWRMASHLVEDVAALLLGGAREQRAELPEGRGHPAGSRFGNGDCSRPPLDMMERVFVFETIEETAVQPFRRSDRQVDDPIGWVRQRRQLLSERLFEVRHARVDGSKVNGLPTTEKKNKKKSSRGEGEIPLCGEREDTQIPVG